MPRKLMKFLSFFVPQVTAPDTGGSSGAIIATTPTKQFTSDPGATLGKVASTARGRGGGGGTAKTIGQTRQFARTDAAPLTTEDGIQPRDAPPNGSMSLDTAGGD